MISIIIPTKNEEENIAKLLASIRGQQLEEEYEIVVADASTDKTRTIVTEFGAKIVQGTADGFIGKGRNNGAKAAKGDVLIFLDADTYLPPNALLLLTQRFAKDKLDVATTKIQPIEPTRLTKIFYGFFNFIRKANHIKNVAVFDSAICLICKKSAFFDIGGFREDLYLCEDSEFLQRAKKKGFKYRVLPVVVFSSRRRFTKPKKEVTLIVISSTIALIIASISLRLFLKMQPTLKKGYGKTGG